MREQNPYSRKPPTAFWRRAISSLAPFEVDPVGPTSFRISREDKVATAGSCFAQHIARTLQRKGFNYYVTERGPETPDPGERRARGFGVFSARYGNIYTTRQLRQLFERAFDGVQRDRHVWRRVDGRYVDAFRPQVEPNGFPSCDAILADRDRHLGYVREMANTLDVFVFTLGLTECWQSCDGWAYPSAPGVAGGQFDPAEHEFINLSVAEVEQDLLSALTRLRRINPTCRILLTVSPVPLVATYRDVHVLSATTYSKSVLRVAAETVSNRLEACDYFPSYEIITGQYNRGAYYGPDAREVTEVGVSHVMRTFLAHYVTGSKGSPTPDQGKSAGTDLMKAALQHAVIVCDEEAIEA